MDPDDPLNPLRTAAQDTIAHNAVALSTAPKKADEGHDETGLALGHGMLRGVEGTIHGAAHGMLKDAPQAMRWAGTAGKVAARVPGGVLSAAELLTAKNKARAAAGVAGGEIGAELGLLVPGAEPITVPLGALAGNALGKLAYDHRDQIAHAPQAAAQWLADKGTRAANMFAHGFDNGMPPFGGPMNPKDYLFR